MKASELVKTLKRLIKKYGDLDLIYSTDDEGNEFDEVYYSATAGYYSEDEFTSVDDEDFEGEVNAICIN